MRRTWPRRVMRADDARDTGTRKRGAESGRVLDHRFASAVGWVIELHRDQTRKGADVPYVAHLIEVAALVLHDGGSESEAIAALLHDAIEDAGVKPKQIRKRYGRKVS